MNHTTRVSIGESELGVYDRGSNERGRGATIVFVHGFPLDHTMWQTQLEAFSPTHRVIAPDLRGFGTSPAIEGLLTIEQMADDLAALLDALDVRQPVVLCGLSMGGYVAFEFLRNTRNARAGADPLRYAQRRRHARGRCPTPHDGRSGAFTGRGARGRGDVAAVDCARFSRGPAARG